MASLNQQQREELRQELLKMKFWRAKFHVRGKDAKSRLAYYRNVQDSANRLYTLFELPTLGVNVTFIERFTQKPQEQSPWLKAKYALDDIKVEPIANNES